LTSRFISDEQLNNNFLECSEVSPLTSAWQAMRKLDTVAGIVHTVHNVLITPPCGFFSKSEIRGIIGR
jgi:hypothetical protein